MEGHLRGFSCRGAGQEKQELTAEDAELSSRSFRFAQDNKSEDNSCYSPDFPTNTGSRSNCSGAAGARRREDFNQFCNCSM